MTNLISSAETYVGELLSTNKQYRLKSLQLENLWLKETDWDTIDLNKSGTFLYESNGGGRFLSKE